MSNLEQFKLTISSTAAVTWLNRTSVSDPPNPYAAGTYEHEQWCKGCYQARKASTLGTSLWLHFSPDGTTMVLVDVKSMEVETYLSKRFNGECVPSMNS